LVKPRLSDALGAQQDVRDVKIVHQARMIRQLKRAVQRDKQVAADATKLSKAAEEARVKLEKEVETLRLKAQRLEARAAATAAGPPVSLDESSPPAAATLSTSTLAETKRQCEELKAKNAVLQAELKRTQRALAREAGEEVPLDELVNGSGTGVDGRRGRAQQIIMLKAKVKKLQIELSAATALVVAPVDGTTTAAVPTGALDVDERAHKELANQSVHRQKQVDKLTTERDALQESTQQLTRKLEALKSRAQVLDKEKQDARAKLQVLVDKSRTDDALVDALQRQVEVWKGKFQDAKRELKGGSERAETPAGGGQRAMPVPSEASQFRALAVRQSIGFKRPYSPWGLTKCVHSPFTGGEGATGRAC
jgi:chromosome segregation ATPase